MIKTKFHTLSGEVKSIERITSTTGLKIFKIVFEIQEGYSIVIEAVESTWAKYKTADLNDKQKRMLHYKRKVIELIGDVYAEDFIKVEVAEWVDNRGIQRFDIMRVIEVSGVPIA